MNIPNLKKRIVILVIAAVFYIVPVWTFFVLIFLPPFVGFPYMLSIIRISVLLIMVYGAFAWVRPSLVPPYLTKKIIVAIMCGIVVVAILSNSALA